MGSHLSMALQKVQEFCNRDCFSFNGILFLEVEVFNCKIKFHTSLVFCPFCKRQFQLIDLKSNWFLIDVSHVQENWVHKYHITHPRISLDSSCGKLVNWQIYSYLLFKCSYENIVINHIAQASRLNITFGR